MLNQILRCREFRVRLKNCRVKLYRIAYAWCNDAMLADDLTQETITRALGHADQLQDLQTFDAWLYRILSNCWNDHHRRTPNTVAHDDYEWVDHATPESEHQQHEIITRVRRMVAALPVPQRQVLTLVDLEGTSYSDVACILEIPVGTVMSRLCRARQSMKESMMRNDYNASDIDATPNVTRIRRQL